MTFRRTALMRGALPPPWTRTHQVATCLAGTSRLHPERIPCGSTSLASLGMSPSHHEMPRLQFPPPMEPSVHTPWRSPPLCEGPPRAGLGRVVEIQPQLKTTAPGVPGVEAPLPATRARDTVT